MTEITTFQIINILFLVRYRMKSGLWREISVSLIMLTRNSILKIKRYHDENLDWGMLGSKMCNGQCKQDV